MTVKERLQRFRYLLAEIETEESRRDALEAVGGFIRRRSGADIERRLQELKAAEKAERRALLAILERLPYAEQRQVIQARYFDGHSWGGVARVLFGRRPDFYLKAESYERRVYRIHGAALANAKKIAQIGGARHGIQAK